MSDGSWIYDDLMVESGSFHSKLQFFLIKILKEKKLWIFQVRDL